MKLKPKDKEKHQTLMNVESKRLEGEGVNPDSAKKQSRKTVDEHFGIKGKKKKKP